jgi:hypothetical protein
MLLKDLSCCAGGHKHWSNSCSRSCWSGGPSHHKMVAMGSWPSGGWGQRCVLHSQESSTGWRGSCPSFRICCQQNAHLEQWQQNHDRHRTNHEQWCSFHQRCVNQWYCHFHKQQGLRCSRSAFLCLKMGGFFSCAFLHFPPKFSVLCFWIRFLLSWG